MNPKYRPAGDVDKPGVSVDEFAWLRLLPLRRHLAILNVLLLNAHGEVMRVFFALELDSSAKLELASWRDYAFKGLGIGGARAVPPDNFHITLAFLGDIAPPELERLYDAVDRWLDRSGPQPGTLALDQLGHWSKPGILWLCPQMVPSGLVTLAEALQGIGTQFGARRSKKSYRPHVTLFRNCEQAPPPLRAPQVGIEYQDFTLFESRQRKGGVSYEPLQGWLLR